MFPIDLSCKAGFHLLLLLVATSAAAADGVRVLETRTVAGEAPSAPTAATHDLRLQLHTFRGSRWGAGDAVIVAWEAARVLSQCGIAFAGGEVRLLETPDRFHQYSTPVARDLLRAAAFTKPAVFFIESMRDQPTQASDAVGRANSAARPELADTVWLAYGEYDVVLTLAHELVHVLTDNAEHVSEAGNLMNGEYSPANSRLTPAQCAQLIARGEANGLLKRR
ncbi:MAG TPA: hypothetical protein VFC14_23415 [Burkholderiales bacterium]|jgi:hypothetical protein|nr:hypothetical protein [Burkholderiales bacterium]